MDEPNTGTISRLADLIHQSDSLIDRSLDAIERVAVSSAVLKPRVIESRRVIASCERMMESHRRQQLPVDPMFMLPGHGHDAVSGP